LESEKPQFGQAVGDDSEKIHLRAGTRNFIIWENTHANRRLKIVI